MKKGKIILGVAAAVVTTASALAFKVANKFTNSTRLYYQQLNGTDPVACLQCTQEFVLKSGSPTVTITKCHLGGANVTNASILYTQRTARQIVCQASVSKYQISE